MHINDFWVVCWDFIFLFSPLTAVTAPFFRVTEHIQQFAIWVETDPDTGTSTVTLPISVSYRSLCPTDISNAVKKGQIFARYLLEI